MASVISVVIMTHSIVNNYQHRVHIRIVQYASLTGSKHTQGTAMLMSAIAVTLNMQGSNLMTEHQVTVISV